MKEADYLRVSAGQPVEHDWVQLSAYIPRDWLADDDYVARMTETWLDVAHRCDPAYGEIGDGQGERTELELHLPGLFSIASRNIPHARKLLRGYGWLTICPQDAADQLGGETYFVESAAFAEVVRLDHGGFWLRATPTYAGHDLAAAERVFHALAPVLIPGQPRRETRPDVRQRLVLEHPRPAEQSQPPKPVREFTSPDVIYDPTDDITAAWQAIASDPGNATAAFELVLTRCIERLGNDHPDTLAATLELASWRDGGEQISGAAAAARRLVSDRIRTLGPDHLDTLAAQHNLISWLAFTGDERGSADAAEVLARARHRVLGPDHRDTLAARYGAARRRGDAGDPAGAVTDLDALLADARRVLGPDDVFTLAVRYQLAIRRGKAGDARAAANELAALYPDQCRLLGAEHRDSLQTSVMFVRWDVTARNLADGVR